jgi:hypothetical protein
MDAILGQAAWHLEPYRTHQWLPTQASNLEVTTEFLQHLCIVSAALGGAGSACDFW